MYCGILDLLKNSLVVKEEGITRSKIVQTLALFVNYISLLFAFMSYFVFFLSLLFYPLLLRLFFYFFIISGNKSNTKYKNIPFMQKLRWIWTLVMLPIIRARIFCFQFAIRKYNDQNIQNHNPASLTWVWNLVSHNVGGTWAEGVWKTRVLTKKFCLRRKRQIETEWGCMMRFMYRVLPRILFGN